MNKINQILIIFYIVCPLLASGQGFGDRKKLTNWYFHLGEVRGGETPSLNHEAWEQVAIPHDWTVRQQPSPSLASATGYLPGGIGWYRTTLSILDTSKKHFLYFEGVYRNSEVYINGHWLGYRPNGYVPFLYDITPYIKSGENVVAVKVDHTEDADSRWYTGSGIYRDAFLVTANSIHLDLWGVHAAGHVTEAGALLKVSTTIQNELFTEASISVRQRLVDGKGQEVARHEAEVRLLPNTNASIGQELAFANPNLWSITNPFLYKLETEITHEGKTVDTKSTNVGFRSLRFDTNEGFFLNETSVKLKGVCLHHDAGVLGSAVPKSVWRYRLQQLKLIGVNAIRMSHNPQATDLYDLCDELGFVVMDEAFDEWEYPKKKWIKGWNVGEPGFQGYSTFFREWAKRDLADMVKAHRNHPSIIMWSIGNEVDFPNDPYSHPILDQAGIDQIHTAGYLPNQPDANRLGDIAHSLAAVVRKYDTTRPVTAALAGVVMSNETDYPGVLDVAGYNYTEGRYQMDHVKYPQRILYGSENRHDLAAWKATADNDFVFGQFLWTGIDYLGEAGPWPSRGFTTGLLDLAGQIKPLGYFRQSLWAEQPMVYLGTTPIRDTSSDRFPTDAPHQWAYQPGQLVRVVAYTNCQEAELWLGNKQLGKRKAYDTEKGMIWWDVPFAAGELRVKAYQDGKLAVSDAVITPGPAAQLRVTKISLKPLNTENVALLKIEWLDKRGNLVSEPQGTVSCKVEGPGKFIAMENAATDVQDVSLTSTARMLTGTVVAYVQSTATSGTIRVICEAEGLRPVITTLVID